MKIMDTNRENLPEKLTKEWFEKGIDGEGTKSLCNVCEIGEEQIKRFLKTTGMRKNLSERGLLAARGWVVKSGSHIWCLAPSRLWCLAPSRLWCLAPALSVATLDHG